ncbi:uncharacterized protein DUF4136 [Ulvibacter sp. MAR_2010_11]|uniref:DUF4136 domain-containing protein n=1 Tax=Ulvibacter sp. MAR_2010_11 TaxID=1250229 RepID=UPI000C2CC2DA|nr:DUF4136 domain-containing protein [Ulvibacter sp. MAR_2010_11]PKA83448.1 uncharacterized protein DUF4136 [Ulvibacter sp. MAR_2010_11]
MKNSILILVLLLVTACGTSVVVADYDKEVDFTQYTSYNYFPNIESGLNELDDKRIMYALDSLLQQRGFEKNEAPQLYINFFANEYLSNSRNTIGIGLGSGGGNVGVGVSGGIPIGGKVINQTLTVDFIDTSNDALVWQAVAEGELKEKATPTQKEAYFISVIEKVLKKYPPKQK